MDEALNTQLELLYDSIGRTVETNIAKVPAKVFASRRFHAVEQDFRGGRSDRQLENDIQLLIHNICSLEAELRHWARKTCRGVSHVEEAASTSRDLKLLFDLWNRKKHRAVNRNGGYTKLNPQLTNFNAQFCLTTGNDGACSYTCTPYGKQTVRGAGGVVTTADIVDGNGNFIAEFQKVAWRAVDVWTRLIAKLKR
jgi:hypothetical protein